MKNNLRTHNYDVMFIRYYFHLKVISYCILETISPNDWEVWADDPNENACMEKDILHSLKNGWAERA